MVYWMGKMRGSMASAETQMQSVQDSVGTVRNLQTSMEEFEVPAGISHKEAMLLVDAVARWDGKITKLGTAQA